MKYKDVLDNPVHAITHEIMSSHLNHIRNDYGDMYTGEANDDSLRSDIESAGWKHDRTTNVTHKLASGHKHMLSIYTHPNTSKLLRLNHYTWDNQEDHHPTEGRLSHAAAFKAR